MRVGRGASTVLVACCALVITGCPAAKPPDEPVIVVVAAPDDLAGHAGGLEDGPVEAADDKPIQPEPRPDRAAPSPPPDPPVTHSGSSPSSLSVKTAARDAYKQAMKNFDAGDYAGALTFYRQADSLHPGAAPKHKVAVCLDKLGRSREAIKAYEEFINYNPSQRYQDRVTAAHKRIAEIRARLP